MAAANQQDLGAFGHNFDFDFHDTSSNFSTSSPGDVLKIKPLDPTRLNVRSGTSVYRLQYSSKDLDGSPVPATAFIALPFSPVKGNSTTYPLVAYAHGTSGIYHGCAPSNGPSLYDYESWQLLIERGYAVVATDYAGLGNNFTLHKYGSYIAQANDVYYSIVAARKALHIFSKDWMSVGHSQGGATVWKLSESHLVARDEHFLGTVSLAPAARLWSMFKLNLETDGAFLGYAAYHAKALQRVVPDYNLTVLAAPLRNRIPVAEEAQLCFSGLMSLSADLKRDEIVSSTGVSDDNDKFQKWENEMAPAMAGHCSSKPVLVVQGLNDTAVLAQSTRLVYEDACRIGSEIHLLEYPAMEHSPVIAAAAPQWLAWIDERFAHQVTPGKCSVRTEQPFNLLLVKAPAES
ncbi:prolyl aminopeptidase (secreted protein) [Cordyceps javanica]|uniref:Prolyl aminopeptidase (Secreted protein) n=1 Tax=Cordyceps javanica TaxID=43265 RepID=A0A545ULL2_9HYPO|nr:prolyl aminopeptidase (secreted protein) [Cordyceps javanica]TQW01812.1 prolyl aminopeptidase (secreted protein) [Cordyceps javanica]